jgi:hypothetical protein
MKIIKKLHSSYVKVLTLSQLTMLHGMANARTYGGEADLAPVKQMVKWLFQFGGYLGMGMFFITGLFALFGEGNNIKNVVLWALGLIGGLLIILWAIGFFNEKMIEATSDLLG